MNTLFSTLTACLGTYAAMFHSHFGVTFTFFCAGRTDVGADLAKRIDIFSIHRHDLGGGAADGCAFQVQPDTFFQ